LCNLAITYCRFYEKNKKEVNAALDLLIDQRPEGGVWGIPWE
jgi:hypothetical protein